MRKKNRILFYPLIAIGLTLFIINGCKKKDDSNSTPALTTSAISNISQTTTANCGGNITSDGGSTVTARGVCWSISQNPTIADSKSSNGTGTGTFTSNITNLTDSTTYYVRAYATNSNGTGYGSNVSFTTLQGSGNTVTDIEGNVYNTVTIGTQVWMIENLKTTKYRNSDTIANVTGNSAWASTSTGAYCNYNNNVNSSITYGRLYNWYAVNDNRNIAPVGWHVPTDSDWTTLTTYLGGEGVAGGKLKESGTTHWQSPNTGATNETGFTALPGGDRLFSTGVFYDKGVYGFYWSSTTKDASTAWVRALDYGYSNVSRSNNAKSNGFSVRCIKD